jgi:transposase
MVKKYVVELTAEERVELEALTSKNKADRNKVVKAFALLKADEGWLDEAIVEAYNISLRTVERIRERFVEEGLEAALNRKPSNRVYRRKIEGDEEAHLIALCCSDPPEGHARWTMQLLADKMVELEYVDSISDETIRTVLNRNELKPWQKKSGASRQKPMQLLSATWKTF